MNNNIKSATTAGLLGIFLGSVGAHDWYLGNKRNAIIHVCLEAAGVVIMIIASAILPAVLSFSAYYRMLGFLGVLSTIAAMVMTGNGIWGSIEGIIILAQGDAGLARKGYAVANPNAGYNNNGYNNNYGNQNGQMNNGNWNNMNQNGFNNGENGQNNGNGGNSGNGQNNGGKN